jgi:hypothetical protein
MMDIHAKDPSSISKILDAHQENDGAPDAMLEKEQGNEYFKKKESMLKQLIATQEA